MLFHHDFVLIKYEYRGNEVKLIIAKNKNKICTNIITNLVIIIFTDNYMRLISYF